VRPQLHSGAIIALTKGLIKDRWSRHPWLIPVILATWEAEIKRITVQSQHRKIVYETLSQKKKKKTQSKKRLVE
jgi:hypothetical protein